MASFSLKRKALTLYNNPMADKATNRHNARGWLRAVCILGDKWILANNVGRVK